MTLYHFTSVQAFPQIFSDGLPAMDGSKPWVMPSPEDPSKGYPTPWAWLTSDPDFKAQDWALADSPKLGCRIEVKAFDHEAIPWEFCKTSLTEAQIQAIENGAKNTKGWFILVKPLTRERFADEAAVHPDRNVPNFGNQN